MAAVLLPVQTFWFETELTTGEGFTVIPNISGEPVQLPNVGVTVTGLVTDVPVAFIAVNDGIFPLPLADKPIEGLLFVQV